MPEAPPSSPGHVGHTPQHVDLQLVRARRAGILSANLPRYRLAYPNRLFPGVLPALQGLGLRGVWAGLLGVEDFRRRNDPGSVAGQPKWPLAFREALSDTRFTIGPRTARR